MNKNIIIGVIVLGVLLGGAYLYFMGKRYEITITQEQIDTALAKHYPVTKKYLLIFAITYSNPHVVLLEDSDRVQVGMDATLNIRLNDETKELGGGATVTSGIRFDSDSHEFFLDDTVFDRLQIEGVPQEWSALVTDFASKVAKEFVETKPVYRLEAKDTKTTAAKLLLKGFEVRNQAINVTLGI